LLLTNLEKGWPWERAKLNRVQTASNATIAPSGKTMRAETVAASSRRLQSREQRGDAVHSINQARAYIDLGQLDKAHEAVNQALALDPANAEAYFVRGRIMQLLGDPEAAIASYQESIAHNPQANPYALNNLALIFIQRGWFNEAVVLLEKAVTQKHDVAFFHHNLGIALQHTGNFHKALAAFQAALMIDPYYVKAQISLNELEKQLRLNRDYPNTMSVAE
jgi:tetratricopeptide (TPR) repeat protein